MVLCCGVVVWCYGVVLWCGVVVWCCGVVWCCSVVLWCGAGGVVCTCDMMRCCGAVCSGVVAWWCKVELANRYVVCECDLMWSLRWSRRVLLSCYLERYFEANVWSYQMERSRDFAYEK